MSRATTAIEARNSMHSSSSKIDLGGSKGGERNFLQVIRQLPPNKLGGIPSRGPCFGKNKRKIPCRVIVENQILPSSVHCGVIEHENVTSEDEATLNAILTGPRRLCSREYCTRGPLSLPQIQSQIGPSIPFWLSDAQRPCPTMLLIPSHQTQPGVRRR